MGGRGEGRYPHCRPCLPVCLSTWDDLHPKSGEGTMVRALETHDGITRLYVPQLSVFNAPGGLEVPVCTFEGPVRTIAIEDPLVSQVFEAAFPAFKAGEQHYRNSDLFGGRYRRYAGSSGALDAGSYFS